jgi:peptidoglycan/LPS O-acetylase OafA/YrhL
MLIGLFGLYLAMTFVVATLSYRIVEAPLLRWRDRVYPE